MAEIERILNEQFGGVAYIWIGEDKIPVSDIAKAIEQWHKDEISKLRITDIEEEGQH